MAAASLLNEPAVGSWFHLKTKEIRSLSLIKDEEHLCKEALPMRGLDENDMVYLGL